MLTALIIVIVLFCINPFAGILGILFLFVLPLIIAILAVKNGWDIPTPRKRRRSTSLQILNLFSSIDKGVNKMAKSGYHSSKLNKSTRK